jgi:hypothetical protein
LGTTRNNATPLQEAAVPLAETLGNGDAAAPASKEKGFPRVGRILVSTGLSMAALLGVILYQHLQNQAEKLGASLVKREDFLTTRASLWDVINKQRERQVETAGDLQQRCIRLEVQAKTREDQFKDAAGEVRQIRAVLSAAIKGGSAFRERQGNDAEEEGKGLRDEIRQLRKRLAALESPGRPPSARK